MKRLPAEWEPQRSVWLTWPGNPTTWSGARERVLQDHAFLIATCSRFQAVDLICSSLWQEECKTHLYDAQADRSRITFHDWPVNDAWTRDHGPLFLKTSSGAEIVDLPYNAWGGKYPPWEDDDRIAQRVSDLRNLPCHRFPMFGEGGGLESNGAGTLLLTESVWLNPNRNPGCSAREVEQGFKEVCGMEKVIWLSAGMASDDTDGHIDTLARFISPGQVVVPCPGETHPDARQLRENRSRLMELFEVMDLPHPEIPGRPASYANFVFLNDALLVPTYGVAQDDEALARFRSLVPDREVVGVPSEVFLDEGGAVHCLTANEWA